MIAGTPSRTALGAALLRAAHQLVDVPPVLEDPLALRIVGPEAEEALRRGGARSAGPDAAALRAFVAVRSRYAEDLFAEAFRRGVTQAVVLGAGLDTFAYRQRLEGVRVIEVDHPATQAWKRERLARAGIAVPASVAYAPVDLELEPLAPALARAGLDASRPAFFAWLGVAPYLTADAVLATLGAIAGGTARGTEVVFDFATPRGGDGRAAAAVAALEERVAAVGEALRSRFDPDALARALHGLGFSEAEVADAAALRARYLAGRTDGLGLDRAHVMRARV